MEVVSYWRSRVESLGGEREGGVKVPAELVVDVVCNFGGAELATGMAPAE